MSDAILPLGAGAQRTGTFFSILIGRRLLSCCRNSRPAYLGGSGLIEFRTSSQRGYLEGKPRRSPTRSKSSGRSL